MYRPKAFALDDRDALHDFMAAHPFVALVTGAASGVIASHVPVLLDRTRGTHGTLVAHLARPNPHWQAMAEAETMAIFWGPHGYISPRWYQAPEKAVPTWNYATVHAHGRARLIWDVTELRRIVVRLAAQYESGTDAWTFDQVAAPLAQGLLKGIVGVELPIDRLEGKFKLSQNRSEADRRDVVAALEASVRADDRALAALMSAQVLPEKTLAE